MTLLFILLTKCQTLSMTHTTPSMNRKRVLQFYQRFYSFCRLHKNSSINNLFREIGFPVVNLRAIYLPLITKFTPPLLQSLQRENNVYRLKYISLWNILTHIYISILFISDRLPQSFNINFCFVFTIIINDTKFTPTLLQSLQRAMSIDWKPHSQQGKHFDSISFRLVATMFQHQLLSFVL